MKPIFVLFIFCAVAYSPSLAIPLIEDDYPNIVQALEFEAQGLLAPLGDPVFRFRSTSYWVMSLCWRFAGSVAPPVYHLASMAFHLFNGWILYKFLNDHLSLGRTPLWAALFFAIHEGHQEAVMWFSAINELLQFGFGLCALTVFRSPKGNVSVAVILFLLAVISKESAVVLLPLFLVSSDGGRLRFEPRGIPFALAAAASIGLIFSTRTESFRFADGSFEITPQWFAVLCRSFAAVMWIWGAVAACYLTVTGAWRDARRELGMALAVTIVSLLPYVFLTYMGRVPSRQTYLASAGLAVIVGIAFEQFRHSAFAKRHIAAVGAIGATVFLHNVAYLWLVKTPQFLERAQPTERVIAFAKSNTRPIRIDCFPRPAIIARDAIRLALGNRHDAILIDDEAASLGAGHTTRYCQTESGLPSPSPASLAPPQTPHTDPGSLPPHRARNARYE